MESENKSFNRSEVPTKNRKFIWYFVQNSKKKWKTFKYLRATHANGPYNGVSVNMFLNVCSINICYAATVHSFEDTLIRCRILTFKFKGIHKNTKMKRAKKIWKNGLRQVRITINSAEKATLWKHDVITTCIVDNLASRT